MPALLKVLGWGLFISFLGSLPLGTLNVAAMQIGIEESLTAAFYFAFGSLLVEMIYVRISLVAIGWVRQHTRLLRLMEWFTFLIMAALAIGSFVAASSSHPGSGNVLLNNPIHRFLLGMLMCAINPVQIPFWFGWSTVLFNKKILIPQSSYYNSYILGIGLGTLLGNAVFIFGGRWLVDRIANSQQYINWVIGAIFSLTAVIQLVKMLRHEDGVSKLQENTSA